MLKNYRLKAENHSYVQIEILIVTYCDVFFYYFCTTFIKLKTKKANG